MHPTTPSGTMPPAGPSATTSSPQKVRKNDPPGLAPRVLDNPGQPGIVASQGPFAWFEPADLPEVEEVVRRVVAAADDVDGRVGAGQGVLLLSRLTSLSGAG
jgi:hypothetical protein